MAARSTFDLEEYYSRQIILRDLQRAGQEKLKRAKIVLAGLGGLGSASALYLAQPASLICAWSTNTRWS